MRDVGTPLRGIVAMVFAAAGVLHLAAAIEHADEPVLQAGFAVVASLQVLVAGIVAREQRPPRALLAGAIAMQIVSVGLWLLSRTEGLPAWIVPGGHVEAVGVQDAVCVLFELVSVPAAMLLLSPTMRALPLRSPRAGRTGVAVAALLVAALTVPALFAAGGRGPLRLDAELVAQLVRGHEAGSHEGAAHRAVAGAHRSSSHRGSKRHGRHAARGASHRTHAASGGATGHAGHAANGAQLASAHAGHAAAGGPAGTPSHAHHQPGGSSGDTAPAGGKHHHHGSGQTAPAAQPAPAASAASQPQPAPAAPPPGPCDPGAPGAVTVADAAGTQVVYQPSSTGGAPVHVCR